jgi:endonuclease YncB( thermonuclease family)
MHHLLMLALLIAATAAVAQPARVIDGDTLEIAGGHVRLIGIDAPEDRQLCQRDGRDWACGDEATAALGELVAGVRVRRDVLGRDRWRRALAVCFAGGIELNREMVRQGWALAFYPKRGVPGPSYDAEQLEAEQEQRGLWSGSFLPPWEWRPNRSKFR